MYITYLCMLADADYKFEQYLVVFCMYRIEVLLSSKKQYLYHSKLKISVKRLLFFIEQKKIEIPSITLVYQTIIAAFLSFSTF